MSVYKFAEWSDDLRIRWISIRVWIVVVWKFYCIQLESNQSIVSFYQFELNVSLLIQWGLRKSKEFIH